MDPLIEELENLWRSRLPLATALGIRIRGWSEDTLTIAAELAPNVNPHGTAFAGSLYSIAALTGWGVVWLCLKARGTEADIVLRSASIDYRRPVGEGIVCTCRGPAAGDPWLDSILAAGRGHRTLHCDIDAGGQTAVSFRGDYRVRRHG